MERRINLPVAKWRGQKPYYYQEMIFYFNFSSNYFKKMYMYHQATRSRVKVYDWELRQTETWPQNPHLLLMRVNLQGQIYIPGYECKLLIASTIICVLSLSNSWGTVKSQVMLSSKRENSSRELQTSQSAQGNLKEDHKAIDL